MDLKEFISSALQEDIGTGDYTSIACIDPEKKSTAVLKVKESGIIAGIELAEMILNQVDSSLVFKKILNDGDDVNAADEAFTVEGNERSILSAERLLLNCMQRMSGIATTTNQFVHAVKGTDAKILDTRKTTPLNRMIEKWAVRIGGGFNHRFGLYDMILIKDNHIDMCGGITNALARTKKYLAENNLNLKVEIEVRNLKELKQVCETGGVDRILIDNFSPLQLSQAILLIDKKFITEASGGINLDNVRDYADTGVDFISVGALTHSFKSIDLSLKAIVN